MLIVLAHCAMALEPGGGSEQSLTPGTPSAVLDTPSPPAPAPWGLPPAHAFMPLMMDEFTQLSDAEGYWPPTLVHTGPPVAECVDTAHGATDMFGNGCEARLRGSNCAVASRLTTHHVCVLLPPRCTPASPAGAAASPTTTSTPPRCAARAAGAQPPRLRTTLASPRRTTWHATRRGTPTSQPPKVWPSESFCLL